VAGVGFATLKNAILPDERRKSAPACIASVYTMVRLKAIPRGLRPCPWCDCRFRVPFLCTLWY